MAHPELAGGGHSKEGADRLTEACITTLRLTDPVLDFWVEIRLRRIGGAWLAAAELAGTPDVGVSTDRGLAILFALWSLGPDVARRMATRVSAMSAGLETRRTT